MNKRFWPTMGSGFKLAVRKWWFADQVCLFTDHFKQFLWNLWIKTFLLLEFLSSGKPQSFSLHFKLDKSLISYSKKLNCTLFSSIWIAVWPQTPNGGLQHSSIHSNCWNFSLNLHGSLLKRYFEPWGYCLQNQAIWNRY